MYDRVVLYLNSLATNVNENFSRDQRQLKKLLRDTGLVKYATVHIDIIVDICHN